VLAALVVHFMPDPVRGLTEMARVTRPGGLIAASTWDFGGGRDPLAPYRQAVRDLGLDAIDEARLNGAREGHLAELFAAAGLTEVLPSELTVDVDVGSFSDWWQPLTLGVGPAGAHVVSLDEPTRARLRARCAELLPDGPITVQATAWTCTGRP
jgi:SAM-dependent methyltransferase